MRKGVKYPGIGTGGVNRLKTHCPHGHPYSKDNVYLAVRPNRVTRDRQCNACKRIACRKNHDKVKSTLFKLLGGKCNWRGCSITDFDMLTLDHVRNDGAKQRVRHVTRVMEIYRRALKEKAPRSKYQLLCANHNLKKEIERQRARRKEGI
jgi:hypothetical protein